MDELYVGRLFGEGSAFRHKINGENCDYCLRKINRPIPESFKKRVTFKPEHRFESDPVYVSVSDGEWYILTSDQDNLVIKFWSSPEAISKNIWSWFPINIADLSKISPDETYWSCLVLPRFEFHHLLQESERSPIPSENLKINLLE